MVIAFNLADVWAFLGIVSSSCAIGTWLVRNRDLIPPAAEVRRRAAVLSGASSTDGAITGQNSTLETGSATMSHADEHRASFVPALASLDDWFLMAGSCRRPSSRAWRGRSPAGAEVWEPLVRVDPANRRYELVYEDDRMDAWILSWMPGQGTGFHDHYISGVGLCVASGCVREDLLVYGAEHRTRSLRAGDARQGGPGYIHRVTPRRRRACRHGARLLAAARLGRPVPPCRRRGDATRGAARPQRADGAADRRRRARARARTVLGRARRARCVTTRPRHHADSVFRRKPPWCS